MPKDDEGPATLDLDKAKQVALMLAFVTGLAFVILVIDWRIKQSILDAAKDVRQDLDRLENHYWKANNDGVAAKLSHYAGGFGAADKPASASNHDMGGDAGMEEGIDPKEDTSSSWSREAVAEVSRINRSAGSPLVEVPKGD